MSNSNIDLAIKVAASCARQGLVPSFDYADGLWGVFVQGPEECDLDIAGAGETKSEALDEALYQLLLWEEN